MLTNVVVETKSQSKGKPCRIKEEAGRDGEIRTCEFDARGVKDGEGCEAKANDGVHDSTVLWSQTPSRRDTQHPFNAMRSR
jgi:hypothetical protein